MWEILILDLYVNERWRIENQQDRKILKKFWLDLKSVDKTCANNNKKNNNKVCWPIWVGERERMGVCAMCTLYLSKQCAHHNLDNNLKQFWFKNSMSKRIWHTYFTHFLQQTSPIQHSTLHTHTCTIVFLRQYRPPRLSDNTLQSHCDLILCDSMTYQKNVWQNNRIPSKIVLLALKFPSFGFFS